MQLSYKYRIYPTPQQEKLLKQQFFFCRFLYNSALQERNSYYKKYKGSEAAKKTLNYYDQAAYLKEIDPNNFVEGLRVHSQTLQDTLKRVDKAYQSFFRRVKSKSGKAGFPRYKSADTYNSISFPQVDATLSGGPIKKVGNKVAISNIGSVAVVWHRPFMGRCKTCMIKMEGDKFYLIISCADVPVTPLESTGKDCALDLGVKTFITVDDGTVFHHPKPYKTSKEKLAYLQRKLQLKKRGSKKRQQVKRQITKQFAKITNIRKDYQHKVAKQLVQSYDQIAIEDLNVKEMMESERFHHKESLAEVSFGNFVQTLSYKAERAGKKVIKVDPKNTSKMCSSCGNIKSDLTLKDRTYKCDSCGLEIDRDLNAALNIRARAYGSCPVPGTGAADSVKEFARSSHL